MSNAGDVRSEFSPSRLRFARERRGLNKEELASLCGVTRRAVTDWEAGRVEYPPVGRLSEALGFPTSFFFGEDIEEVTPAAVSFRALSTITPREMRRVLTHASLLRAFSSWIDRRYETPPAEVPSFEELTASVRDLEPSPVDAAGSLRAMWSLGSKPIPDMLALVESRGVRVFGLPREDRSIDAFSFWWGEQPFIMLNTAKSGERLRFDLAHELGHLCMHRGVNTNRKRRYELDANTFASCFLMPAEGLVPQIVGQLSMPDLIKLKAHWRVSATAMARRLHQLARISDWQYRSWMIELSELGFRTSEPGGRPNEQSALLRQVLALAREDGWGIDRISKELGIPERDMIEAIAGLAIVGVARGLPTGALAAADRPEPPPGPPRLQVVR